MEYAPSFDENVEIIDTNHQVENIQEDHSLRWLMKTTLQDPIIKWVCTMLPQPPQIYVFVQIIFSKQEPKK